MNTESQNSTSVGLLLARIGAVVLALSVLVFYVYRAQQSANERERARQQAGDPAVEQQQDMPAALPSSKVLVIEGEDEFLPSSKSRAVVPGQRGAPAVLPSTKGIVLDESAFLHGSKSGVIVDQPDVVPLPEPEAQPPVESFLFGSKSAAPLPAESPLKQGKAAPRGQTIPKK